MRRRDLALSLAVHALVAAGVLAAGARWGADDPAPVGRGTRLLWVSLETEPGAPGPAPGREAVREGPPAAPLERDRAVGIASAPVPVSAPPAPRVAIREPQSPALGSAPSASPPLAAASAAEPAPRAAVAAAAVRVSSGVGAGAGLLTPGAPVWPGTGEVDVAARPRWPIRPDYPALERQRGREGTVVVEAWVDERGEVAFSDVLRSGGPRFDVSARRAVERSSFRPARLDGRDVASRVALRIHFDLYE